MASVYDGGSGSGPGGAWKAFVILIEGLKLRSPNRVVWSRAAAMAAAKTRAKVREAARAHTLAALGRNIAAAQSSDVLLLRLAPRAFDGDNLVASLKNVRDGVADALGVKDNDPRVTWKYEQRRGRPKEYAVEIRIELRR